MNQLQTLKMLLGIKNDDEDLILGFILESASQYILDYCHLDKVPIGLENTLLRMCMDNYRASGYGNTENQGSVKSIAEGDVAVTFGNSSDKAGADILTKYLPQLNAYRKAGW